MDFNFWDTQFPDDIFGGMDQITTPTMNNGEKSFDDLLQVQTNMAFDDLLYGKQSNDFDQKLFPCQMNEQKQITIKQEVPSTPPTFENEFDFSQVKMEPLSPQTMVPSYDRSVSEPVQQIPEQQGMTGTTFSDIEPSLEIYRDLVLKHLITDIASTCSNLGISADPNHWTPQQSALWLQEMVLQFQLDVSPSHLYLPGRVLCLMSQEQFAVEAPGGGETLHAQLQIWKTAVEFATNQQTSPEMKPILSQHKMIDTPHVPQQEQSSHMTLRDWLSKFDPNTGLTQEPNCSPGSSYSSSYGSYNSMCAGQSTISDNRMGKLLSSPTGSDSGISAGECTEYDYFDNSPLCVPVKPRRQTVSGVPSTGNIHLWQFLRELLDTPENYNNCVRWLDRKQGIFKIENSHQLAKFWGQRKNRTKMNYDKLSRSLRQYYKKNIIRKTGQRQRLIYQFTPPYNFS